MIETLANGYSSESTQRMLSYEYQHDRVLMDFKNICILVLWLKVASAMEELKLLYWTHLTAWLEGFLPRNDRENYGTTTTSWPHTIGHIEIYFVSVDSLWRACQLPSCPLGGDRFPDWLNTHRPILCCAECSRDVRTITPILAEPNKAFFTSWCRIVLRASFFPWLRCRVISLCEIDSSNTQPA